MSSPLLSFVLLCIVFIHSAAAQDLDSPNNKALDSQDHEYEMRSIPNGYKNQDLDYNENNKYYREEPMEATDEENQYNANQRNFIDYDDRERPYYRKDTYSTKQRQYRVDPYNPYQREYREKASGSIANAYKNKDLDYNQNTLNNKYYKEEPIRSPMESPMESTYNSNNRAYRSSCCPGFELSYAGWLTPLCYPQCISGFHGVGPVCWSNSNANSYGRGAGVFPLLPC